MRRPSTRRRRAYLAAVALSGGIALASGLVLAEAPPAHAHSGAEAEALAAEPAEVLVDQSAALLGAGQDGAELRLELLLERDDLEGYDRGAIEAALAALRSGDPALAVERLAAAEPPPPTTATTATPGADPPEAPPSTAAGPGTGATGGQAGAEGAADTGDGGTASADGAMEGMTGGELRPERSLATTMVGIVVLVIGVWLVAYTGRRARRRRPAGA